MSFDSTFHLMYMTRFNKITIIGVGLIGGSIGLAIRKRRLAKEVIGVFRRRSTLRRAMKRRAVDRGVMDIADGVRGADLIIIATPVHSIPALTREAAAAAKKGAIITDAGSTKGWIVGSIEKMPACHGVSFVGSHPMAGSEHTSVEYARDDLICGAACIVTRTRKTDAKALAKVAAFWKALGGRVSIMDPVRHDASVSMISHLPHIVAFSLAGSVDPKDLRYAAEGFKDTTRVASSDPGLWADIFLTNRRQLLRAGRTFDGSFRKLLGAVAASDRRALVGLLSRAKATRDRFADGSKH